MFADSKETSLDEHNQLAINWQLTNQPRDEFLNWLRKRRIGFGLGICFDLLSEANFPDAFGGDMILRYSHLSSIIKSRRKIVALEVLITV